MSCVPFLSIIVPFHNSAKTCAALLSTLVRLRTEDSVELILVDDGSTDLTLSALHQFSRRAEAPVKIVERSRGGPGAARNSGLQHATGQFVWFVDSDDDIDLTAIQIARSANWPDIDLVAWDWQHPSIVRRLAPGLHSTRDGPAPPDVMDPIVCNWFSLAFLKRTRLRFPEYCFYEATPIEFFVLPLLLSDYAKVDFVAYRANTSTLSVTRAAADFPPTRYDYLRTVALGMAFVDGAALDTAARRDFEVTFARLYLWYLIEPSRLPDRSFVRALRIMRQYRDEAGRFGIRLDPLKVYPGRRASRLVMTALWHASAALPSQEAHFRRIRARLWERDIFWDPPEMPPRWREQTTVSQPVRPGGDEGSSPPAQSRS